MMGGILVATVLTIFVLPAGYALFFGREPKNKSAEPPTKDQADDDHNTIQLPPAVAAE
jgi:hypothetical protein